jgi:hypothetical protein
MPYGGYGGCSSYGCYPYPIPFQAVCTGTLIAPNAVLTSRSCAAYYGNYYYYYPGSSRFVFAIGADVRSGARYIDVVHVSYPADGDLAVLHLGEAATGVTPFPLANLNANHVGQRFAALGYGNDSNYGARGERRAGAVTLRGLEGRIYEFAYGSFEEFFAHFGGGYADGGTPPPIPAFDAGTAGAAGFPAEDGGGWGGSWGGSGPTPDAGVIGPDADIFPPDGGDDWYREQLLAQYNGTLLGPTEAYAGGAEGDAQPCYGDEGGPLARAVNGQVRLFGVMSRLVAGCERGAVYTRFTPELRDFVTQALRWRDPCDGVTRLGRCDGNVAVRCAGREEGERRAVRFDCSLLAQTCVSPPGSEVACSD